ncbi:MAG: ABC transporter ATP-binding protein [Lachnospiraceae bacterium]|nr:ABC transporter ATP-binding protein [Lachnospiraceae bacterium]MDE6940304.1 ABC transporter ATP-binding protein [Lachnospiraceae bacterium]
MKSKPAVMEHFSTVHTSFIVDFEFTNNISILMGDSGTGKTMTFSFMKECMAVNPSILCLNYLDYQKNIVKIISQEKGRLIIIDNADILLDDVTRKYISLDDSNQYLIIGRNPKNLFATKENLFELVSEQVGEQTKLTLKEYL